MRHTVTCARCGREYWASSLDLVVEWLARHLCEASAKVGESL